MGMGMGGMGDLFGYSANENIALQSLSLGARSIILQVCK